MTLQELLQHRTQQVSKLVSDRQGVYWYGAVGAAVFVMTGALVYNPTWPGALGLLAVCAVWLALKYFQQRALEASLLDESIAKLITEMSEEVRDLNNRFTAMSNRLGSVTGVGLQEREAKKSFRRI